MNPWKVTLNLDVMIGLLMNIPLTEKNIFKLIEKVTYKIELQMRETQILKMFD